MLRRLSMVLLLALGGGPVLAQAPASLSGFVRDATSGETLLLANVVLAGTGLGTATNNAGYYTLTGLRPGTYTVVVSYLGFREERQQLTLAPGEARRLDVDLAPADFLVDEVVVTGEREEEEELRKVGVAQISTEQIKQIPAVLEPDVFRSLQLLPGVKASSDYSSGLYIRGGSPDQTLILLDRNTVYNPSHVFGFFSTFNPDAIKDVRLYKGGFPAQYGGRLGSVVDIYNKDGNRLKTTGSLSLGLLASRALAEGPYARGSWMLAARRSTLEPLLAALNAQDIEGIPEQFYFYDFNGKLNFDASRDDKLSLAFYAGSDKLRLPFLDDAELDVAYGNRTLSLNWTHIFSQQVFSNFTLTGSRYFSNPEFRLAGTPFTRDNDIYDFSAKGDFEYVPNERHTVQAGGQLGSFTFRFRDTFDGQERLSQRTQAFSGALYVQETFRPAPAWSLQAGLRANFFSKGDYVRLEPRLSVEHRPSPALRLQAGYGRYYQFLSLISNELLTGFDIWLTTDEGVPPSFGDQFVLGVKTSLGEALNVDVEGYYRTMQGLFEIDPFLPDAAGLDYAQLFRFGDGYAWGGEVFVQKPRGRVNGFVGYTYGQTRRRFPNVNDFAYYAPKYDRTHDLNVVANLELGRGWRATSVFKYATGQAYTEPSGQYKLLDDPFGENVRDVLVTEFNRARLPAYHRLDLGVSRLGRFFGVADYELQLQVINAYNRRNIWFYFFEPQNDNTIERNEIPQIPVPLPNVSFTLRF